MKKSNTGAFNLRTVWSAHTTVDEMGRRGDRIGLYDTEDAATEAANGRGWYGGAGQVQEEVVLQIGKLTFLLQEKKPVKIDRTTSRKLQQSKKLAAQQARKKRIAELEKELASLRRAS